MAIHRLAMSLQMLLYPPETGYSQWFKHS